MAQKSLGFKIITSCRGSDILKYEEYGLPRQSAIKNILRLSSAITTVSNEIAINVSRILANCQAPIVVIPNGVNLDTNNVVNATVHKLNSFVYVGHLDKNKGLDTLLRAFEMLAQQYPIYKLVIVGDGPLRDHLERLGRGLQMRGALFLEGKIPHHKALEIIKDSLALILPSLSEGCPNVILEAMAVGTPVIGSNVGGIKEIIRDQENGLLFDRMHAEELRNCMEIIAQSTEMRQRLIRNALHTVKTYHNNEKIMARYLELYRQILNNNSPT